MPQTICNPVLAHKAHHVHSAKRLAPPRVLQIATHAVVIGTIIRRVSLAAHNAQITVLELIAVLVHHKRVPVAKLMRGLAQLACQRQLGLALLAIKGTLALKLCQQAPSSQKQINGVSNASVSAPASLLYT